MCRAGCQLAETTYHTVQTCHRTAGARIDRHNSVASYVANKLKSKGYIVIEEPRLNTVDSLRKPDILALKDGNALILDAQVVSDANDLNTSHERKRAYYNTGAMKLAVHNQFQHRLQTIGSITLSWRGVWSQASANELIRLEIIRTSDTALLSTRVLIGSFRCFTIFNASTAVWWGIG